MRHTFPLTAALFATLAVLLTGCSRNPVAPSAAMPGEQGAGTSTIAVVPEDTPPSDGGTPLSRQVSLRVEEEGVVVVGRWTLWLRKNTLRMPATVKLSVDNAEAMDCHIEVSPPEANDFQSPAVLTANLSDVPNIDYSATTMAVWNGSWQDATNVGTHPNQQNVVAHFNSLFDTMVAPAGSKWKNKLGA